MRLSLDRLPDGRGFAAFGRFLCHAYDRRCAGKLLKATVVSAGAWRALGIDRHVARLTGHAGHAVPQRSFDNDAATDARSQRQHARTIVLARGTEPEFAHSGRIRIVFQDDLGAQPALNLLADGIVIPPGQVR